MWCDLCKRWETEADFAVRHPLSPEEEAGVAAAIERQERERRAMGVPLPATRPTPRPRPELSALADRIRQLRKALGLSQADLARTLGMEVLAVKRWESGKVQPRQKILKWLGELEASLEGGGKE